MGPYSQKNLDKNCGAPFGLDKMLVLVIKQLNWTPIKQKIKKCAPFELTKNVKLQ